MKAVIIAAGQSSRLWKRTNRKPKTLLPFGNGTILSTIIDNLKSCGIHEFVLVVGWKKDQILEYVAGQKDLGAHMQVVDNTEWERGNGISVLAAKEAVGDGPFLLSMSDHIVSPEAIKQLVAFESPQNLLLVDERVNGVFDIDDATKVMVRSGNIVRIGKELTDYNAIDCGVFRLDGRFFEAMVGQATRGQESISAAVTGLIQQEAMGAVPMQKGATWIDIDTPEAYHHALGDQAPSLPLGAPGAIPR